MQNPCCNKKVVGECLNAKRYKTFLQRPARWMSTRLSGKAQDKQDSLLPDVLMTVQPLPKKFLRICTNSNAVGHRNDATLIVELRRSLEQGEKILKCWSTKLVAERSETFTDIDNVKTFFSTVFGKNRHVPTFCSEALSLETNMQNELLTFNKLEKRNSTIWSKLHRDEFQSTTVDSCNEVLICNLDYTRSKL